MIESPRKERVMITLKRRGLSSLLACCLAAILWSGLSPSAAWAQMAGPGEMMPRVPGAELPAPLPPDQLDQLVAPIALYPDALVAQILAASTYPTEVVEAARWEQANPGLQGPALAAAVDSTSWDPSIKALTQFPSMLADMNNNLAWTSELGQAYFYQPQDVLNAIQVMRQRAYAAGTLVNTPQQRIVEQNGVIMIEPVNPGIVYVPEYNPGSVYGAPVAVYPGYSMGEMIAAGVLAFGAGIAVGVLADQAWGWHGWDTDWHHHHVMYRNNVWVSNTNTFYSPTRYRGGYPRGQFGPPARGGPQRGGGRGYGGGAAPNPPAREHPQVASRGPRQMGAPAEARPGAEALPGAEARRGTEARPTSRTGAPSYRPPAENRQAANRVQPRPAARNMPRPQARAANPYRGFGRAPATGMNRTAFARMAPGGHALAYSARGRASMGRASRPARAAPAAYRAPHQAARPAGHKR
jgi:Protein of unknown function (DUF3300)